MSTIKIIANRVPLYWMNETTGVLRSAVIAFLDNNATEKQIELVIAYCKAWVDCQVWKGNLAGIRESIREVKTSDELRRWIHEALDEGIDPL